MINTIKISSLRNNEFLQFLNDVCSRCENYDIVQLQIEAPFSAVKEEISKLTECYNKEKGSSFSEVLADIDANRDGDIIGIKTVCEGYVYMRDERICGAAQLVLDSINRHGKALNKLNYQAETLVIDAILKAWKNDEVIAKALDVLNLKGWAAMLEAENEKFSDTYQKRVDDNLLQNGDSFSELRPEAVNAYKALSDTIFAYSVIKKNQAYEELINAFNVIIDDYNILIERREGNKTKELS